MFDGAAPIRQKERRRPLGAAEIRRARKARHLTQEEVATRLQVDPITVYRWEAGVGRPSLQNLSRLDDMLNKRDGLAHPFHLSFLDLDTPAALLDGYAVIRRMNAEYLSEHERERSELEGQFAGDVCRFWSEILPAHSGVRAEDLAVSDIHHLEIVCGDPKDNGAAGIRHSVLVSRMEKFSTVLIHVMDRANSDPLGAVKIETTRRLR